MPWENVHHFNNFYHISINEVPLESLEPQLYNPCISYIISKYPWFGKTPNLSSKRSYQGHIGHEILKMTKHTFDKCHKAHLCQISSFYHIWLRFYAIFCDLA